MKRSPLVRKTPLRRTSMPRAVAARAREVRTARLAASVRDLQRSQRLVRERDGGRCVRCGGKGEQHHHRRPRGMGGASRSSTVHLPSNLVMLCRRCHLEVELNREAAIVEGFLVRHGVVPPAEVPLWHVELGWVLLDDEGGVSQAAAARRHNDYHGGSR